MISYQHFHTAMKMFPVFPLVEIRKRVPNFDTRRLVEWQAKGYVIKIRNGWYAFADEPVNEQLSWYAANRIYPYSYISLETALSYYGFIPEGVFQVTSCSTLKTNRFNTPLGHFKYRHIKPSLFLGYRLLSFRNTVIKFAEPEKTLIDYLYLHPKLKHADDFVALRWNSTEINATVDFNRLRTYETYINSAALSARLDLLRAYLNAHA
ncbi:MAG: hypothetical protein JJU35_13595 [Balneolales bacterium]|nr:hypothetical protein [Balneolales bacterium]